MPKANSKSSNPARKTRRARNLSKQPLRKLQHVLKRSGLRAAFEYANEHGGLANLRTLVPDYQNQLRELGNG